MQVETYTAELDGGRSPSGRLTDETREYLYENHLVCDSRLKDALCVIFADPHEVWALWTHCRAHGIPLRLTAHTDRS